MQTYVIKRDGFVIGDCTAEESVGPLAWFNRNVSYSMAHAIGHEGYSFDVLMTRKDFWTKHDAIEKSGDILGEKAKEAREALHHEYNVQFVNDAVRNLVKSRIGNARLSANT